MPNTTDTYWSADGTSLQTYVQNIETKGGSRWGVAPLRGTDSAVSGKPGEDWRRKIAGPRVLTLQMWLAGEGEKEWTDNWIALRKLLWRTDRRVSLTKRWKGVDGIVRSAVGKVEYLSGLEPSMVSDDASKCTVDFKMADPYFYGAEEHAVVTTAGVTVDNVGDDITRRIRIESMSNAKTLKNLTTGRDLSLDAGTSVIIDVWSWDVTGTTVGPGDVNVSGDKVEQFWFSLFPGENELDLVGGSTDTDVYWTPVYL